MIEERDEFEKYSNVLGSTRTFTYHILYFDIIDIYISN